MTREAKLYTARACSDHRTRKTYINANNDRIEAVLGRSQENNTALAASEVTLQNIDGKSYVVGDEVTVWEFVNVYDNVYNIKAPDGRYMNIGNQTASLSNTPQNITVTQSGNGLRLDNGGYGFACRRQNLNESGILEIYANQIQTYHYKNSDFAIFNFYEVEAE